MFLKRIFISILLLVLMSQTIFVFALSKEQKGIILQTFKREEFEMIFESDASIIANEDSGILSSSRKINIYNSIGENIKSKREYLEFQSQKIVGRVNSLEESITELDDSIEDIVKEVNKINYEIVETKDQIDVNKATIALIKRKIDDNTNILLDYVRYMYKKGDYLSHENDIDTIKTILLSGEDIAGVINELHYKGIIQLTGQKLIEKHRGFISALYVKKLELEKDEIKLKQLRKSGMLEKIVLDDKRGAKERLLDITKGKEELYQKYIDEKLAIEKNIKIQELKERIKLNNTKDKLLEKYGCDFVDLSQDTVDSLSLTGLCLDVNKIIFAESRLRDFDLSSNPLVWPITPHSGISAYFRDDEYRADFKADHDAIDIIAPQRTDVRSPHDGYIVHIEPPLTNQYSYVAIKHGSGLVTIHGHLNEILVEKYDFIKKGETFARSGGEYGTRGAGLLTTGPHLHFGVYQDQQYADPLKFLDVSLLSYEDLPERYRFKFSTDFRIRKGYEYTVDPCEEKSNTFCIKGDTEIERQKYLLSTYAVGPFQNWNLWVEESIDGGLDPTFVMCIGLAETTLGKYLKTPYNIGNVGNTDSGATTVFYNARSGVYAMVQTLNNRFLSQYDELDQLSRYGNKDGSKPIYASSDFNWHNNITKCMSHIKGEYVPDNYKFRISQ